MSQPLWPGAFNLADLGGHPLIGGGETRCGSVFRSGRREAMALDGWEAAIAAGLTAVVDLRNLNEIEREAAAAPSVPHQIIVHSLPVEDPGHPEFESRLLPYLDHPRPFEASLEIFPELFARVFGAIANAEGAVLVHCSGGRDRTGLVTAVLLLLAGVELSAILADYERAVRDANEDLKRGTNSREVARSEAELAVRIDERREALHRWLTTTDAAAILAGMGLTGVQIARLGSRLAPD